MDTLSRPSVNSSSTNKVFSEFTLAPDVLNALNRAGIHKPTAIQEKCIPPICEGKDVVGKAETGTGKTIGFAAPLIGGIDTNRVAVQALVLTPTRELAQQVAGVFEELGAGRNLGVALVVGGVHASEQVLKLRSGSQVVVGTPGRVLEFIQDRTLSLVWCETVVLDEADRMLDMGFIDDVTSILDAVPSERQTLLFSATVPPEVQRLLRNYMKNPQVHSTSSGLATVPEIRQTYMEVEFPRKFNALQKALDARPEDTFIVFCNTRRQAIDLDRMLWGHGYSAGALHGDREQDARFRTLEAFRNGDIKILVATDVASRGLDIDDVGCVVNYEIPEESEGYVHRIGRTGRAQKSGHALSLVSSKEWSAWQRIIRATGFPVERCGPERIRKSRSGGASGASRSSKGGSRSAGRRGSRDRPRGQTPARGRLETREGTAVRDETRQSADSGGSSQSPSPEGRIMAHAEEEHMREESRNGWDKSATDESVRSPRSDGDPPRDAEGGESEGHRRPDGNAGSSEGDSRPRRRRRRGRGSKARKRRDGPQEGSKGTAADESGEAGREQSPTTSRTESSRGRGPRRERKGGEQDLRSREESESTHSSEEASSFPSRDSRERSRQPKPSRLRLDDVDDDFVKTDYFSVNESIIERAGGSVSSPRRSRGDAGPGEEGRRDRPSRKTNTGSESEGEGRKRSAKTPRRRRRRRRPGKKGDSGGSSTSEGS